MTKVTLGNVSSGLGSLAVKFVGMFDDVCICILFRCVYLSVNNVDQVNNRIEVIFVLERKNEKTKLLQIKRKIGQEIRWGNKTNSGDLL